MSRKNNKNFFHEFAGACSITVQLEDRLSETEEVKTLIAFTLILTFLLHKCKSMYFRREKVNVFDAETLT